MQGEEGLTVTVTGSIKKIWGATGEGEGGQVLLEGGCSPKVIG